MTTRRLVKRLEQAREIRRTDVTEPFVSTRRVLFVSIAAAQPMTPLRRAAELADSAGAELHLLRVLTSSDAILHERQAAAATHRWCADALPRRLPAGRVRVSRGMWLDAVVSSASRLACDLIVLPARQGRDGRAVTTIAAVTGMPVLVARRPASSARILAATDLQDPRTPVLMTGVDLAIRLRSPLTFFHNVPPLPPEVPMALGLHIPYEDDMPTDALMARRMERLRARARLVAPTAEAIVVSRLSTASAILDVSRKRQADLVLVGVRRAARPGARASAGVARRVVENAANSVMVVPMSERTTAAVK